MDGDAPRLPFDTGHDTLLRRDEAARRFAVDPRHNVVLEASAGTGKTTVLVTRYLNLLKSGVDPINVLAITFTRKAAAEMRQRIVHELQRAAAQSPADAARWRDLRDRLGDISISTIDAFCLSLLREFPLEAGLEPGFEIADETMVAGVKARALEQALRVCGRLAARDEDLRLLWAHLGPRRLDRALGRLLDRRLVVRGILRRYSAGRRQRLPELCVEVSDEMRAVMSAVPGGLDRFLADGPHLHPAFALLAADLRELTTGSGEAGVGQLRAALDGVRDYFLTRRGEPRQRVAPAFSRAAFPSEAAARRHAQALKCVAPDVSRVVVRFDEAVNRMLARGVGRAFEVAVAQFTRALQRAAVLDFSGVLERALDLLARMDEFSQSRYRLESRYHHVLVDEFQDTSRAQWRLVSLLVKSWGEGAGLAHGALPPSIFVVGDRKQSIYGFRDADLAVLGLARRDIGALRPNGRVRRSISRSFRSAPALLAFANDLFASIEPGARADRFRFEARDRFPVDAIPGDGERLGLVVAGRPAACASAIAAEIERLIREQTVVRDVRTRTPRAIAPGDVAVLFRSREGHQDYERALAARSIPSYVYKGLGFFDADETKDLLVLLDYLARPDLDLRAAAFLRSRFVRLSDAALAQLAPAIARSLLDPQVPSRAQRFDSEDGRVFARARTAVAAWLPLVDMTPPSELLERVLADSAYAYETRGARRVQARENIKKMRALVRRIENRGYATVADVAAHLRTLSAGDESNAVVDAIDAVNLMTVHAAKGLEFPVVFLVNLARGTGGGRESAVRVTRDQGEDCVSVGQFISGADDQALAREREETKRLLYVAVTRARDRLYLSGTLRDGRFSPAAGSLGAVLPAGVRSLFEAAAAPGAPSLLTWCGPGGHGHRFDVRAALGPVREDEVTMPAPDAACAVNLDTVPTGRIEDAFAALVSTGVPRVAATRVAALAPRTPQTAPQQSDTDTAVPTPHEGDERLLGRLVHRVFQVSVPALSMPLGAELVARAASLLTESETVGWDKARRQRLAERAARAVDTIFSNPDLRPLLGCDSWTHEVPFSLLLPSVSPAADAANAAPSRPLVVRGVIDSLADTKDSITVVELKTGQPRPQDAVQLDCYLSAARLLYPGRLVRGVLVYSG